MKFKSPLLQSPNLFPHKRFSFEKKKFFTPYYSISEKLICGVKTKALDWNPMVPNPLTSSNFIHPSTAVKKKPKQKETSESEEDDEPPQRQIKPQTKPKVVSDILYLIPEMYKVPYNLFFFPTPIFFKSWFFPKISAPSPLYVLSNSLGKIILLPLSLLSTLNSSPQPWYSLSFFKTSYSSPAGLINFPPPLSGVENKELYIPLAHSIVIYSSLYSLQFDYWFLTDWHFIKYLIFSKNSFFFRPPFALIK